MTDLGHDQVKPDGGDSRSLDKVTIATAWSPAPGIFGRPEVRLFYTYARWNEAARLAATPGDALSTSGVFGTAYHGSTFGLQAEHWW